MAYQNEVEHAGVRAPEAAGVILVVEAESEHDVRSTLDRDPWSGSHLVVASVDRWTIRLDGREKS